MSGPARTRRATCLSAVSPVVEEFEAGCRCICVPRHRRGARGRRPIHRALARRPALSPIDGMPVGIKDIIETADMPTEQGSPLFVGWRIGARCGERRGAARGRRRDPRQDGDDRVCLDRAARHPQPLGLRAHAGRLEQRLGRRGGLRHGSGGLGTQVVGSIIRPASFCGCVGFKPSVGADQPWRQLRLLQPELHRRARRDARRRVAGGDQYRRAGRRRSGLSRATRARRTAAGAQPSCTCLVAHRRLGGRLAEAQQAFEAGGSVACRSRRCHRGSSCRHP